MEYLENLHEPLGRLAGQELFNNIYTFNESLPIYNQTFHKQHRDIEGSAENQGKIVDPKSMPGLKNDMRATNNPLERVKYCCEQCDYNSSTKRSLSQHVHSRHEGKIYSCDHCYYKATGKSSLCQHMQSIHDKVKYSCEHCEFKTNHVQSEHEGLIYSYDHC